MNRGLGHAFLKHVERTRLLVYVIDLSEDAPSSPVDQWNTLRSEFQAFNPELLDLPSVVAGNKTDLPYRTTETRDLQRVLKAAGVPLFLISALSRLGVDELRDHIASRISEQSVPRRESLFIEIDDEEDRTGHRAEKPRIETFLEKGGSIFIVRHHEVERLVRKFNFDQEEALGRFSAILRYYRVEDLLLESGAREGDTVRIGETEFEFYPEVSSTMKDRTRDEGR
jgi:GTP-binding protein